MLILNTAYLPPELNWLQQEALYNGKDCCVTAECDRKMAKQVSPEAQTIYQFEMAMQKPALQMMFRGINIDMNTRTKMMGSLRADIEQLEFYLDRLALTIWEHPLNHRSPAQLFDLFYKHMRFPVEYIHVKGEKKASTNRECLERLHEKYLYARPLINVILALRDAEKKLSVLDTAVDPFNRFRCSYNIGGTNTGRWSSSRSAFGRGSNAQNITKDLREAFIPDDGYFLGYADLEQAESRVVAYIAQDGDYIQACESADLHTTVTKFIWPDLPWVGDNGSGDRAVAEQPYYRHYSYRYMAKRAGHASNYLISPWGLARALKLKGAMVQEIQERYYDVFRGIRRWHGSTQEALQSTAYLRTPMGRGRHFFDRLSDDSTLRKAVAFVPQSTVADILNLGLYRVWREMDRPGRFEILGQVHDAIIFQVEKTSLHLLRQVEELMKVPLTIHGRSMVIPVEIELGLDWKNLRNIGKIMTSALRVR